MRKAGIHHKPGADPLRRYSPKQRNLALLRWEAVKRLRRERERNPGPVRDWMPKLVARFKGDHPQLTRVSVGTLYRWDLICPDWSAREALIDGRGGDKRSKGSPEAWAFFASIYLDKRRPSLRVCWERTKIEADRNGWEWGSVASCLRQINTRIPRARQRRHRGADRAGLRHARSYSRRFSILMRASFREVARGQ